TFRYKSTVKILPPSLRQKKGQRWTTFTPPAAGSSRRYRGRLSHRRSHQAFVELKTDAPDIAVAIGITHDIANDVRRYVEDELPSVGRLLVLRPSTGSSSQAVVAGRHAFDLAQSAKELIRSAIGGQSPEMIAHVFVAAPNALTFFLGQQSPVLGCVRLYEFDFEGGRDRSYRASLTLPVST
ncbi:SAVED domain-containing protein, partial [Sedimentitalea sp.]|uniref:SAVED domain-containing protein n=1 Tax=Sedimentitalea sp. TaxID=2048915 RepID=UPI00329773F3